MGMIIFNGKSSADLGIRVARFPDYNIPERNYDVIHVPGRNGDVIIDSGSFSNVTREYEISIAKLNPDFRKVHNFYPLDEFYNLIDPVVKWLYSANGYARLEDTYDLEHYRMATYRASNTIENLFNRAGRATIAFDCKPQRYFKSGDRPVVCDDETTIHNSTGFASLPNVIATIGRNSAGIINIGSYQITISAQNEFDTMDITINSELQDAYSGTLNCNSMITLSNGEFPKLEQGDNLVTFSGGVSAVTVIPRWWTI